jgi:hypothetical protein
MAGGAAAKSYHHAHVAWILCHVWRALHLLGVCCWAQTRHDKIIWNDFGQLQLAHEVGEYQGRYEQTGSGSLSVLAPAPPAQNLFQG